MILKNKQVLITAGPTWVPIDSVRVISNIATAQTGLLLAKKFNKFGAKVTLIAGPGQICCLDKKIRVLRFKFFNELQGIILRELKSSPYDIVLHSAAVSDYQPALAYRQKLNSGRKNWILRLIPTPKIINAIKKIQKNTLLVAFKFIPQAKAGVLSKAAKRLLKQANADLVIANTADKKGYAAYIVSKDAVSRPLFSKAALVNKLTRVIRN